MRKTTERALFSLWRLEDLLYWIAWGCSFGITAASAAGMIKQTSHQKEWSVIFWAMGIEIMLSFLVGLLQKRIVSRVSLQTLYTLDQCGLFRHGKIITEHNLLKYFPFFFFLFNLLFARFIWEGNGHDIGGTWQFTAGAMPGMITLLNALFSHEGQIHVYSIVTRRLNRET